MTETRRRAWKSVCGLVWCASSAAAASTNPALVVTQVPLATPSPGGRASLPFTAEEGARLVLVRQGRITRVLTVGFASAADPDVSDDGRLILFSGKRKPEDRWAIFEMRIDGTVLRMVISGTSDYRGPIYLPPIHTLAPDPRRGTDDSQQIAFTAVTRNGEGLRTSLHSCRPDGTHLQRIAFNPVASLEPSLLRDGRVVFSAWQEGADERRARMSLVVMNTDGTDPSGFTGDTRRGDQRTPCVTSGGLVVFVENRGLASPPEGTLARVDLRRNLHSYRPITRPEDGLFRAPAAVPEGGLLAAWRPVSGGSYRIVRIDPLTGLRVPIFDDPRFDDVQVRVVAPKDPADHRSSVVGRPNRAGRLYGLDLRRNDLAEPLRLPVRLRLLDAAPDALRESRPQALGLAQTIEKRILGEIPVADDCSYHASVPADTPLQLQLLDADGAVLRTSGWIWVRGGAALGCIGCHEDGELTPANRFPKALSSPPTDLASSPQPHRMIEHNSSSGEKSPAHARRH